LELPSRGNTFDESNYISLGQENDMNARNITFARSDTNKSSNKSLNSLKKSKKLERLEQLYTELSLLENSIS
jgi:hypothetical protein